MTPEYVADIRSVLADFLVATGIQLKIDVPTSDDDLMKSIEDSALAHGFDEKFIRSSQFQIYLRLGTFAKLVYGAFHILLSCLKCMLILALGL